MYVGSLNSIYVYEGVQRDDILFQHLLCNSVYLWRCTKRWYFISIFTL